MNNSEIESNKNKSSSKIFIVLGVIMIFLTMYLMMLIGNVGNQASLLQSNLFQLFPQGKQILSSVIDLEEDVVEAYVRATIEKQEKPFENAYINWSDASGWYVEKEKAGKKLPNKEKTIEVLVNKILKENLEAQDPSLYKNLTYESLYPEINSASLGSLYADMLEIQKTPLEIVVDGESEIIDIQQESYKWYRPNYEKRTPEINLEHIENFIQYLANKHNIAPGKITIVGTQDFQSEYVSQTYTKAIVEGNIQRGRQINEQHLREQLKELLLNPLAERKIELQFTNIPMNILSEVEGLEFPDLISVGTSDYSLGNYPNRVHNIKHALGLQNLTIVQPQETFSFNKVLGWVTLASGFQNGQVIFGNSLANVPGGGVCQVSTTLFRAAIYAGFPIVDRKNHSWDVSYYRDQYGIDAAIYPPGRLDLQFVNDSPGPILIVSHVDSENEIAYFEFYGKDDGRKITVNEVQNYRVGAGRKVVNDWIIEYIDGTVDQRSIVSRYSR